MHTTIKTPSPMWNYLQASIYKGQGGTVGRRHQGCGAWRKVPSAPHRSHQHLSSGSHSNCGGTGAGLGDEGRHCPACSLHSSMRLGPAGPLWGASPAMATSRSGAAWSQGEQRTVGEAGGLENQKLVHRLGAQPTAGGIAPAAIPTGGPEAGLQAAVKGQPGLVPGPGCWA